MRVHHILLALTVGVLGCNDPPIGPAALGAVRVDFVVSGLDPDPDGFELTVNGVPSVVLSGSNSAIVPVEPGRYTVVLGGIAANCNVVGVSSQRVWVTSQDTAVVSFPLLCLARGGIIEITATTAGVNLDPDGYVVSLDGGVGRSLQRDGSTSFSNVPGGAHSLTLGFLSPNCTVTGANPMTGINVSVGSLTRDTVRVGFAVNCATNTGALAVVTSTTGSTPDPDGYVLSLTDPGPTIQLAVNDSLLLTELSIGTYTLSVDDISPHCSLDDPLPPQVTITPGATAILRVAVTCANPAAIRVTAPTTGSDPDPGYLVRVDNGEAESLLAGGAIVLLVLPGAHSIGLSDIAGNCVVGGPNPVLVTLPAGDTTDVVFPVTCSAIGRTGVDIIIATTGMNQDTGYGLAFCSDYYCYYSTIVPIPGNGTLQHNLAPGSYSWYLSGVATNCRALNTSGGFQLTLGEVETVQINVECGTPAGITVTVPTTGADPDEWHQVYLDGNHLGWVHRDSALSALIWSGVHTVSLDQVGANCTITSTHPVTVTIPPGATGTVQFTVHCQPYPTLLVTVTTTGNNQPANFRVGVDPDWYYGYAYSAPVAANGAVSTRLYPGTHYVVLEQVPGNCSVAGNAGRTVDLLPGTTTDVQYQVTCQ